MIAECEIGIDADKLLSEQSTECVHSGANWAEKEERLGEDGFAGHQGMAQMRDLLFGPVMMDVPPVEQRRNRSRINENASRHILSGGLC